MTLAFGSTMSVFGHLVPFLQPVNHVPINHRKITIKLTKSDETIRKKIHHHTTSRNHPENISKTQKKQTNNCRWFFFFFKAFGTSAPQVLTRPPEATYLEKQKGVVRGHDGGTVATVVLRCSNNPSTIETTVSNFNVPFSKGTC